VTAEKRFSTYPFVRIANFVAFAVAFGAVFGAAGLIAPDAAAQTAKDTSALRFSGEANVDTAYALVNPFDTEPGVSRSSLYLGATSLRLDAVGGYRDSAKVDASILTRLSYPGDDPKPSLEVKKLYLSVFTEAADLSAGRMIVNYGRGTVFSPVDLFSTVDLSETSWGRIGTDAVRVLVPFSDLSGLDLVSTLAKTPENATAGGRLYGHFAGWDLAVSAFRDQSAFFAVDLKGDAVVGVSAEAVARVEEAGTRCRFMGGIDYSLGGEWFFDLEYLANFDFGTPTRQVLFSGDHNVFASVTWAPDKLTSADLRAIAGFDGGAFAALASVAVSRSVARGATLTAYARYLSGDVEGTGAASASVPSLAVGARLSVAF